MTDATDANGVSQYVEMMTDAGRMAEKMTSGANKMLANGWAVAILHVTGTWEFSLSVSPPRVVDHVAAATLDAGGFAQPAEVRPEPTYRFDVCRFNMSDLPTTTVEAFKAFMQAQLGRAIDVLHSETRKDIVTASGLRLQRDNLPPPGEWYEAKGDPARAGWLTRGAELRYGGLTSGAGETATRQRTLATRAKEHLDSLQAELAARESIARAMRDV